MTAQRLIGTAAAFALAIWLGACGGSVQDAFPIDGDGWEGDLSDPPNEPIIKTGELTADEVWKGHVIVSREVIVPDGVTLTVERGARVQFDAGVRPASKLIVEGALYAQGDFQTPASFIAEPRAEEWHGVLVETAGVARFAYVRFVASKVHSRSQSAQFSYCQFENASDHPSLAIEGSSPTVEDCRFQANFVAIRCLRQARPQILNNTIVGNVWGVICDEGSEPTIDRNVIANNRETGVLSRGASSPEIQNNNIMHNGAYAAQDGGRLFDNFIQGNNGVPPGAVERSLSPQGTQVFGVEEVVSMRSSQNPEAGDRRFR